MWLGKYKQYTVQYSTVQYSTVQYSTVQYSTVQYSTVYIVQCSTLWLTTYYVFTVVNIDRACNVLHNLEFWFVKIGCWNF